MLPGRKRRWPLSLARSPHALLESDSEYRSLLPQALPTSSPLPHATPVPGAKLVHQPPDLPQGCDVLFVPAGLLLSLLPLLGMPRRLQPPIPNLAHSRAGDSAGMLPRRCGRSTWLLPVTTSSLWHEQVQQAHSLICPLAAHECHTSMEDAVQVPRSPI
ncbi:unnamed protein product [Urochloa humidicola]